MWEWWNSLESVTRFRWWMGFLGIFSVLIPAIFGGLRWIADNRRDYLKEQLAKPRQSSTQQQEQFLAIVKEEPQRILIQSPKGDPEAFALARELRIPLGNAEWIIDGSLGEKVFNPPLFGIQIKLERAGEISVLVRALKAVSLPPTSITFRTGLNIVPYKWIKLNIGHKPKPSDVELSP